MTPTRRALQCGLVLFGLSAPVVHAANSHQLLVRMQAAAQELDYDGVFVYQHGDQLESFRILHKGGQGGIRERLVSLNGAPREIIRNDQEVRCYLPDKNSVLVEHRRADRRNFPAMLPDSIAGLSGHYQFKSGKKGRVAGRTARSVEILPRDGFRYGYQMWADQETGLLLKASLINDQGAVVEQYLFTHVSIGKPIPETDLESLNKGKSLVWHRTEQGAVPVETPDWEVRQVPPGYSLTERMMRKLPKRRHPVEHLVYSDGLAVVSVFIERATDVSGDNVVTGHTQMGAIHAFGTQQDGHQITVIGETPAATVGMIGESVSHIPGTQ